MSTLTETVMPLESGDRLTRAEFHRRYCQHPEIKKAELIEGVVYVASPVRFEKHGKPNMAIVGWLYAYVARTPGVEFADNATVFLAGDAEVQPDALLFWPAPRGAGVRITEDGYLQGPPDLVVEVAASSASYDLHDKKEVYRRAGVPEYAVWRIIDGALDWFDLQDGVYVRREPGADGIIESRVFPGLRLAVPALLAGDHAAVLAALSGPAAQQTPSSGG
jgi:Uma2 family endonuclease